MNCDIAICDNLTEIGQNQSPLMRELDQKSVMRLSIAMTSDCLRKASYITRRLSVYSHNNIRALADLVSQVDLPFTVIWHSLQQYTLTNQLALIHPPCLLVAANAPSIPLDYIYEASEALLRNDFVLGPAIDGRCYLIGFSSSVPGLFQGMTWECSAPASCLLSRAAALELETHLLPEWYRVDTEEDLHRLELETGMLPIASPDDCPYTRKVANEIGLGTYAALVSSSCKHP